MKLGSKRAKGQIPMFNIIVILESKLLVLSLCSMHCLATSIAFLSLMSQNFIRTTLRSINIINLIIILIKEYYMDTLVQRLHSLRESHKMSHHFPPNIQNQSYLQQRFHKLQFHTEQLLKSLIRLHSETPFTTPVLDVILSNILLYSTSLLTYCDQIHEVLGTYSKIALSHQHHSSQSVLLALYLKHRKYSVHLVTASLVAAGHLLAPPKEEDKESRVRQLLTKEGITRSDLLQWQPISVKEQILIVDLFDLPLSQCLAFLHTCDLSAATHLILYHSQTQEQELAPYLAPYFTVEVAPEHPLEVMVEESEEGLQRQLFEFLKEQIQHPQKQDIIIFTPNVKKTIQRITEQQRMEQMPPCAQYVYFQNRTISRSKNNVFVVQNSTQLVQLGFSYYNVLCVVDYGVECYEVYRERNACYVNVQSNCTEVEKCRRMAYVGVNRMGRYVCLSTRPFADNLHPLDKEVELWTYCLKMVQRKQQDKLIAHPRVQYCVNVLKELDVIRDNHISDEEVLAACKAGIDPLSATTIYRLKRSPEQENHKIISHLLVLALCVMRVNGNLRQTKGENNVKPSAIWRKSGYLQSCIEILIECDKVDNRKNKEPIKSKKSSDLMRRKTSKLNDNNDMFGCLFLQDFVLPPYVAQEKQIPDIILEYSLNPEVLTEIRSQIDHYKEVFGLDTSVELSTTKQSIATMLKWLITKQSGRIGVYSGSRRTGYLIQGHPKGIFPHKTSMMSQLNERPDFILLCRLSASPQYQVMYANAIHQETYMEVYHKLPIKRVQSLSETELQYHGLSNSMFDNLWRNNGAVLTRFETEYDCFVECNQEVALLLIHCKKEKSEEINKAFEAIMQKIKEKLAVSTKTMHYMGKTKAILGEGGAMQELLRADYINRCLLDNLHLDVTKEDLEELFEEFFALKEIIIEKPEPRKTFKSAIILFNSKNDYYRFKEYYHECPYYGRLLIVKPLGNKEDEVPQAKQYIKFRWSIWKSHCKAIVNYREKDMAMKAYEAFKVNPLLDDTHVKVGLEETKITLTELNPLTDEIFLYNALNGYGVINDIEVLKTPLKENANDRGLLQTRIKECFAVELPQDALVFENVDKEKSGMRACKVIIKNIDHLNVLTQKLNNKTNQMGEGRLYAQAWFDTPVLVPNKQVVLFEDILKETIGDTNTRTFIKYSLVNRSQKMYLSIKSKIKATLDMVLTQFKKKLRGYPIQISQKDKGLILTDIGLANLSDLEEKYGAKLIIDYNNKSLAVLCRNKQISKIRGEIKSRINENFFYRVSLNNKAIRHFQTNQPQLQQLKSKYLLTIMQFERDSRSLILEGSAQMVQDALNFLMHLIESLSTPAEQMVNVDVCGICCQAFTRPYRLQACSHNFCRECLLDSINSGLGDMTTFPLKCPHCLKLIVLDDLEANLSEAQWQKVLNVASNQYVARRPDTYQFCLTPGCKQINLIEYDTIKCDVCNSSFCVHCKNNAHRGKTCEEAKTDVEEVFKKYMKENGIRECPNEKCKMPIFRIDGCFRVTCSRCNSSMCFKCEPDKMIAYPNYNDCYKHLNDVHGGYW